MDTKAQAEVSGSLKNSLLLITNQILDKYKDHPACIANDVLLPVLSNQKHNSYLKELADICNMDKKLTSHSARHTFGTTNPLSDRVPIESVKQVMGHQNIKQTLHYARVLPIKLSEDMQLSKERLDGTGYPDRKSGDGKDNMAFIPVYSGWFICHFSRLQKVNIVEQRCKKSKECNRCKLNNFLVCSTNSLIVSIAAQVSCDSFWRKFHLASRRYTQSCYA